MESDIGPEFIAESVRKVTMSRDWILHSVEYLDEEDIWWSPGESCNSVGTILQHLLGNLRQWVLSGFRGDEDVRDRPREFRAEERVSKDPLVSEFEALIDEVLAVYSSLDPIRLLEEKTIQGRTCSALSAIYRTVPHLQLHAGQIAYMTKLRVGNKYEDWWHSRKKPTA
ncbi:DUF1572 family protein [Candidatus Hydrogenedentota bacterium]